MDEGPLLDAAAAIADGLPVDWATFCARTPSCGIDLVSHARIVERIAQLHASLPDVGTFTSPLHQSLAGLCLPGDAAAPPESPVTWGPFTIVEPIGRGTFGDVYRAHDGRLNRTVALKLLRRRDRRESAVIDEGHLLARVRHPNVVTVYGAERIEGRVGLWMQFVDGPTLDEEVRTRGPFAPADVAAAGVQLAQALAAVHGAGLLHRDVKAQNAMRDADGRVLLTDFGTGRELGDPSLGGSEPELAGTPLYIAPEVLNGAPASVASDVYALGVLLYYLATGSFPVRGRSLRDLRAAHQRGTRQLARAARADLPKRLATVIDRATDPDPTRRPASAAALEAALTAAVRPHGRRMAWLAVAASITLAAVSGIAAPPWRVAAPVTTGRAPRDFVLVSRFDNRTGDTTFDGGIEYAVATELNHSDLVEVIPADRVLDALQLMKRPVDTIVDRTVGREVCLRDGRVKAQVAGRIEKAGGGYALTAELVDPADGVVVASVTDTAASAAAVLPAIAREAQRLIALFGERRGRITGATPVEQVSTSSLAALQLYNQAARLLEVGTVVRHFEDALQINGRALAEDPAFASAWSLQAWLLRQIRPPGPEARDAAARSVELAETAPEWERRYIRGVAFDLDGDHAQAASEFEAVVRLRPGYDPGLDQLLQQYFTLGKPEAAAAIYKANADRRPLDIAANFRAAQVIVRVRHNLEEARPYVNRLDELLTPDRVAAPMFYAAAQWRRSLPAYEAWTTGNLAEVRAVVDREASVIDLWPEAERGWMHLLVGYFYVTLGRLHDAEPHLLSREPKAPWGPLILFEARQDLRALRRHLLEVPVYHIDSFRFVEAGLLDQARSALDIDWGNAGTDLSVGRGALELATGHPESTVGLLRPIVQGGAANASAIYQTACDVLASALVRLDRRDDAIAELERCAAVPPPFQANPDGNGHAGYWMKNLLRLADEYRTVARVTDAERVEQQLRRLLVYADADNPLVVRLNHR